MPEFDAMSQSDKMRKMDHGVPRGTIARDQKRKRGPGRRPLKDCEWHDPQCECEMDSACKWGKNNMVWNSRQVHEFPFDKTKPQNCIHCGASLAECSTEPNLSKYCP